MPLGPAPLPGGRSPASGIRPLISAPSTEDHPAILADWLELLALSSPKRESSIRSLSDVMDITQDAEAEDIGDFDAAIEAVISRVTTEIEARVKYLEAAYPFRINSVGTLLTLREDIDLGSAVYLFCLLMSHVSRSSLLENFDLTSEAQAGRDIFQICATLSAAGYCDGPAVSFGWPRRDRSAFSAKLAETYVSFGDGTPRALPLPAAPDHIKDGGIDVIGWRPARDGLPGTFYLLGQVASGHNWHTKTVLKDIDSFHWAWFEVQPVSQHAGAMFVPFCITDTGESAYETADQAFLISKMQFIAKEFGHFIYRYKLPFYASKAPGLGATGTSPIEGLDEVPRIYNWVNEFRTRLLTAAV
jgi:hypothetical protein